jgi:hypothetical protein
VRSVRVVYAQDTKATPAKPAPATCDEAHFECVSPGLTTGSAAFNQVLAHQLAADQVMVQGIDLLKMDENILNLLRTKGATLAEIQKVVDDAKVPKPLRLRPQP